MVSYKMQTPTDSKLVDGSVYSVISEHWVHSEQIRWTLLSNFLTANSLMTRVFSGHQKSRGVKALTQPNVK